jgi:hypothetical protein
VSYLAAHLVDQHFWDCTSAFEWTTPARDQILRTISGFENVMVSIAARQRADKAFNPINDRVLDQLMGVRQMEFVTRRGEVVIKVWTLPEFPPVSTHLCNSEASPLWLARHG